MPLYEGNISHVTLTGIIDLIKWFSSKKLNINFILFQKTLGFASKKHNSNKVFR